MNSFLAFALLITPHIATFEKATKEPCNTLTGPQLFTIAIAIVATFAGVILAKVFKDKDDKNQK